MNAKTSMAAFYHIWMGVATFLMLYTFLRTFPPPDVRFCHISLGWAWPRAFLAYTIQLTNHPRRPCQITLHLDGRGLGFHCVHFPTYRPSPAARAKLHWTWMGVVSDLMMYTFPLTVHPPPSVTMSHWTWMGVSPGLMV